MTRRKLFSLLPAGLLTALVPRLLKKKEEDPVSVYDKQYGPWQLLSTTKDNFQFVHDGPEFLTMNEGWAWIDSLYIEAFQKENDIYKIHSYEGKTRWIFQTEQKCKDWISSLRLIGRKQEIQGSKEYFGDDKYRYYQKLELRES